MAEVVRGIDVPLTDASSEAAHGEFGHTVFTAPVFARRIGVALIGRVADEGHIVCGYRLITADCPVAYFIIVPLEVGEHVDDFEVSLCSLDQRKASVAVGHEGEGLVGLCEDRCVRIGMRQDVDVTRCKHVPLVEAIPVLIATRERVAVGDVRPSVAIKLDGLTGGVVDLHPTVGSRTHTVLGDEELARSVGAEAVVLDVGVRIVVGRHLVLTTWYGVGHSASALVSVHADVAEVVRSEDVPLADASGEAAHGELGHPIFTCTVFTGWVWIALVEWLADEGHVVRGHRLIAADCPVAHFIIVPLEVGEHVDDLEIGLSALHQCEACVSVRHEGEGLVGLSQDGGIGIWVCEDVDVARREHMAGIEAIPVLIAAWEWIAVGHIGPSVSIEEHIVSGRVVNLNPTVGRRPHTVLRDEQVASGNLRLRASTAIGVHAEVAEVGRAAHEPLAVVGAAAEAATEELGDAVLAAQVLTGWVWIALVLRTAHEHHIVRSRSVAHAPVSDLIVVALVVGEEVDDLEIILGSANKRKAGIAIGHERESLVRLGQDGRIGVRVGQHVDIARLQDMAGVEAVPVLVGTREWVAVGDIGPSVVVKEHWGTRRVVDLHVAVVGSSDHTVLGDEQVARGGLDLSATAVVLVRADSAVVVRAAHLPLAVRVAGTEAATDKLGHAIL